MVFPLNAKVRFTQKRLSLLTPRDRQGLAGRIGMTETDSTLVRKPTISFPADGSNLELRLFRVDPNHIELVEISPNTEITPNLTEGTADLEATASESSGRLSQSEMDNLFD
jgi:hypothetical protein